MCCRLLLAVTSLFALVSLAEAAQTKTNVLFIAIDDLRPELSVYGKPVITPNMERLAAQGTVFERAYCQVALCQPTRASLLSGRRPDTIKVYQHDRSARTFALQQIIQSGKIGIVGPAFIIGLPQQPCATHGGNTCAAEHQRASLHPLTPNIFRRCSLSILSSGSSP